MFSFSTIWCLFQSWRKWLILKLIPSVYFPHYHSNLPRKLDSQNLVDMTRLSYEAFPGSTAIFFRPQPGIILKAAVKIGDDQVITRRETVETDFSIEEQILRWLGPHPRITRFLGTHPSGLLFAEASHGSLGCYLDRHNTRISLRLRQKWCVQAVESVVFIHGRGVIHGDLRPDNFLLDGTGPAPLSLDLCLCDFGGSTCQELALSGGHLPDSGFFNPKAPWVPSFALDLFSLGSILYAIVTGHWPFRSASGPFTCMQDKDEYEATADACFANGNFPSVEGLFGGDVMLGCWNGTFSKASEVMAAFQ